MNHNTNFFLVEYLKKTKQRKCYDDLHQQGVLKELLTKKLGISQHGV